MLRDSTSRIEGPLIRWSVRPSVTLYFFLGVLEFRASLLLPKRSVDLNRGPCPPTRNWVTRHTHLVRTFVSNLKYCRATRAFKSDNSKLSEFVVFFIKIFLSPCISSETSLNKHNNLGATKASMTGRVGRLVSWSVGRGRVGRLVSWLVGRLAKCIALTYNSFLRYQKS